MLKQYQYDQDKNLTGLFVQSGNAILANNRYLYDGNGNRTHKQQLGGETLYHYDPLNQLQKVQYPGYTEELFYDKAGNRTRRVTPGTEELYQYDPRNRLTAYTKNGATTLFRYDHAGNLLSDDKARYSYDAFNRTTQVETFDGHVQVNRYDAEGLRHEMEENGSLVKFIFNPDREVIAEQNSLGITRYIRSSELIARNTDAARTYYHYVSDEMGSTTHIVDEDGIVFNHYTYDAWGNLTAQEEAVPNRFKFTGQQLDPVTQQYYLRARFYNPVIARFTQEDSYRGDGLNLYAYCQNNPIFYSDPSGNVSQCLKDAYNKHRKEGLSATEAYKAAKKDVLNQKYRAYRDQGYTAAEAYQAVTNKIGVKPQAMTDNQMQMAIDYIYKAGNAHYNSRSVQALTITPEGRVVLSANSKAPIKPSIDAAKGMFGDYLSNDDIVRGNHNSNYQNLIFVDPETGAIHENGSHAEARAAAHLLGDLATVPVPQGALQGTRQATSAYACDACASMQESLGIKNVTGTRKENGKIQRLSY